MVNDHLLNGMILQVMTTPFEAPSQYSSDRQDDYIHV